MVCRVCSLNVKKSAVLCSQCSLISHAKCAINAPPTCDLRAQLLLYAQYAEKGNPASVYSNPAEIISDMGQNVAMSDVPFVDHNNHTPRNSIDSPQSPHSPTSIGTADRPPTAFKFMAAFRRSRTNLSPEPVVPSSAASNGTSRDGDEGVSPARRRPQVLTKRSDSRPLSVTSDSTGLSSLRSAATAAESFSSRQNTSGKRSQTSNGDKQRPMSDGVALERGRSGKANMMSSGSKSATTDKDDPPSTSIPGGMPNDAKKKHRSKSSNSSCQIQ